MNLQTTINLDYKTFWSWWMRELAFLVPERVKSLFSEHDGYLLFSVSAYSITCRYEPSAMMAGSSELVIDEERPLSAYLQQNPRWQHAESVLLLQPQDALRCEIELPLAAQENLHQVVGFELDRYTPFRADHVYFATQLQRKTVDHLEVGLIYTPRARLEQALERLKLFDVRADRVVLVSDWQQQAANNLAYNLLPPAYQQRSSTLLRSLRIVAGLLITVLLLALLLIPLWQEQDNVDWLKQQYKTLEKPTQAVEAQQQAIDRLKAETQAVIDFKQRTPSLLQLLAELTHLLDDSTWLNHLQYAELHLQIQGQSKAASALIAKLEASPYFHNVNFVSPLTQDKVTGLERFQISMDVVQPEPVNNAVPEPESAQPAGAS